MKDVPLAVAGALTTDPTMSGAIVPMSIRGHRRRTGCRRAPRPTLVRTTN